MQIIDNFTLNLTIRGKIHTEGVVDNEKNNKKIN